MDTRLKSLIASGLLFLLTSFPVSAATPDEVGQMFHEALQHANLRVLLIVSDRLTNSAGGDTLYLNKTQMSIRSDDEIRWTITHELGHIASQQGSTPETELAADIYAINLLYSMGLGRDRLIKVIDIFNKYIFANAPESATHPASSRRYKESLREINRLTR